MLTWADLANRPHVCPDVPCAQQSRFVPAGRSSINPVTFCELAWHGITVRGPKPTDVDAWADRDTLRVLTANNLRSYWRGRGGSRQRRIRPLPLAIGLSVWFPFWAVLGVSRLHHTLATGWMASKCGVGRYARDTFDQRWHRIIDESLHLRTRGAQGRRGYRNPVARRRDTLAFPDTTTIDAALILAAEI